MIKDKKLDKSVTIIQDEYMWLSKKDKAVSSMINIDINDIEGVLQIGSWNNELVDFIKKNNIDALEVKGDKFEMTNFSLSFLSEITNLKYLRISGKFPKKEYKYIELLVELEQLSLADYEGYELDLLKLKKLKSYFSMIKHDNHPIFKCSGLKYLGANFSLENLNALYSLEHLKKLFIFSKQLKSIDGLERLVKLQVLDIEYATHLKIEKTPILDTLKKISFDTCKNIDNLNFITSVPNLQCLSVPNCASIESLIPLKECKKIEFLLIADTKIEDNNLSILKEIKTLQGVFFQDKKTYDCKSIDFDEVNKKCTVEILD